MLRPIALLLVSSLALQLQAEDDARLHHVRLTVHNLPSDLDVETTGFGGSIDSEADADSAGRLGVGYWYGGAEEVSFLIGGGLDVGGYEFRSDNETTEFQQDGIFIEPGVAVRFASWFSAEAAVRFGVGRVQVESTVDGLDIDDTAYGEFSLRLRGVFTVARGLELLVETGYLRQQFSYEFEVLNQDVEQEVTVDGIFGGIAVGWGF